MRLNANTGKITGFVTRDTLLSEATLEPTVVSRWLSVDPVVHPYESPYAGFANNPVWFVDPDGRKIKLAGTAEQQQATLDHLRKLTNDDLYINAETGTVERFLPAQSIDNVKLPTGTALVRRLIDHGNTVTIDQKNSQGTFESSRNNQIVTLPTINDKASNEATVAASNKGTDVWINFVPGLNQEHYVMNEDGEFEGGIAKTPDEISLGHELIHAEHVMDGTLVPRKDEKGNPVNRNEYSRPYKGGKERIFSAEPIEELRTTGILPENSQHYDANEPTENKLRKEQGVNERLKYNSKEDD